jgi:hypothetical protein
MSKEHATACLSRDAATTSEFALARNLEAVRRLHWLNGGMAEPSDHFNRG